jgi:hypothetical protein
VGLAVFADIVVSRVHVETAMNAETMQQTVGLVNNDLLCSDLRLVNRDPP